MMTRDENNLFYMFIKIKPLVFHSIKIEDAYEFIIDYCERLHKIVVKKYELRLSLFS